MAEEREREGKCVEGGGARLEWWVIFRGRRVRDRDSLLLVGPFGTRVRVRRVFVLAYGFMNWKCSCGYVHCAHFIKGQNS